MADNSLSALASLIGAQQALGQLQPAYEKAQKRYDVNYFDPFTTAYAGAPRAIADAFGLGGAEGTQRTQDAFRASPGYGFARDQGLEALNRTAASRGMLTSGNNTQDILKFSQGLADQEYGKYLAGLGSLADAGFSAAQGQTGRQGSLAGLDMGYGTGAANIWQNTGNTLADLYKPRQQQSGSGIGSAIAGGLQLGGSLLGGLSGLGAPLSTSSQALRARNGQAEWSPW